MHSTRVTWADQILERAERQRRLVNQTLNFNLNGLEDHQQIGECINLKMVTGPSDSRSLGDSESDSVGLRTRAVRDRAARDHDRRRGAAAGRGHIQVQLCPIMAGYTIWFNMLIV